jgi:hypothetical protein
MAFARVKHEHADATRASEQRTAWRDRRMQERHVVAERLAEAAALEEVAACR